MNTRVCIVLLVCIVGISVLYHIYTSTSKQSACDSVIRIVGAPAHPGQAQAPAHPPPPAGPLWTPAPVAQPAGAGVEQPPTEHTAPAPLAQDPPAHPVAAVPPPRTDEAGDPGARDEGAGVHQGQDGQEGQQAVAQAEGEAAPGDMLFSSYTGEDASYAAFGSAGNVFSEKLQGIDYSDKEWTRDREYDERFEGLGVNMSK